MSATRRRQKKKTTARQLFDHCTRELAALNARYESLFQFVHDPNVYDGSVFKQEILPVTLDCEHKAGDTIHVRIPIKFIIGKR